jgi:hypothetical protein
MSLAPYEVEARGRKDSLRELTDSIKYHGWTCATVGAVAGLAGGFLAALLGSALLLVAWVEGAAQGSGVSLHRWGTILLLLTMPLLVFGAHCLDRQEAASKWASKRKELRGR